MQYNRPVRWYSTYTLFSVFNLNNTCVLKYALISNKFKFSKYNILDNVINIIIKLDQ